MQQGNINIYELLKENEIRLTVAEKNGDAKALSSLLADDFIGVDLNGNKIDKECFIKNICNPDIIFSNMEICDVSFRIVNNIGIVIGKTSYTGTFKSSPFTGATRFLDIWEQKSNTWSLISSSVTRII